MGHLVAWELEPVMSQDRLLSLSAEMLVPGICSRATGLTVMVLTSLDLLTELNTVDCSLGKAVLSHVSVVVSPGAGGGQVP
jgi:hypothetical protein